MARKEKKLKSHSGLFGPVAVLLVLMALGFALAVFFRVSRITVTGNNRYSKEEIILASGIEAGDNLFFINRGAATARINAQLPYVERAWIQRQLPNRVEIHVTESDAIAVVHTEEDGLWAIDHGCKLLAQTNNAALDDLIEVTGFIAATPEAGEDLRAAIPGDEVKVEYLAAILEAISGYGMQNDVSSLDISSLTNPSFQYLDRFTVKLGRQENLEYKFRLLLTAVEKNMLSEGDRGTLDLGIDGRIHLTQN